MAKIIESEIESLSISRHFFKSRPQKHPILLRCVLDIQAKLLQASGLPRTIQIPKFSPQKPWKFYTFQSVCWGPFCGLNLIQTSYIGQIPHERCISLAYNSEIPGNHELWSDQ